MTILKFSDKNHTFSVRKFDSYGQLRTSMGLRASTEWYDVYKMIENST